MGNGGAFQSVKNDLISELKMSHNIGGITKLRQEQQRIQVDENHLNIIVLSNRSNHIRIYQIFISFQEEQEREQVSQSIVNVLIMK
jgi:hypothetical protein